MNDPNVPQDDVDAPNVLSEDDLDAVAGGGLGGYTDPFAGSAGNGGSG